MDDDFDLERFMAAQSPVLEAVLQELRAGAKRSHWMWFIFPQLAGLGHSPMARHYAIANLAEARAYLAHAVLGERLLTCTQLVNAVQGRSVNAVFGSPDDMKFRSSMTLFARASPARPEFSAALQQYFGGQADTRTVELLDA